MKYWGSLDSNQKLEVMSFISYQLLTLPAMLNLFLPQKLWLKYYRNLNIKNLKNLNLFYKMFQNLKMSSTRIELVTFLYERKIIPFNYKSGCAGT